LLPLGGYKQLPQSQISEKSGVEIAVLIDSVTIILATNELVVYDLAIHEELFKCERFVN
tara:strand:+ start:1049 stop:1225 length:177 start_codon:yes stop_codon:yes gene_type:complete